MATITEKDLGQVTPSAATATTLVTGSTTVRKVALKIAVVNNNSGLAKVRVAKDTGTTVAAGKQYAWDEPVPPGGRLTLTGPIVIDAAGSPENINVYSDVASVTFTADGYEAS
jgi:hypothetical protein